MKNLLKEMYKAIFFLFSPVCHQRPDRSFHIKGKQLPLCARCTGLFVGYIIGIVLVVLDIYIKNIWICLALITPLVVDGLWQAIKGVESLNIRRFVVGLLTGISFMFIIGIMIGR